ncbi:MAG: hypothetical protein KatS3mg104_2903 [Phycisphaerae bacterium]|jgi:hypothetical protein|nr:MAG: hypothetical protein KatS3mg104_2903 [Phycisphaerae bacterium]
MSRLCMHYFPGILGLLMIESAGDAWGADVKRIGGATGDPVLGWVGLNLMCFRTRRHCRSSDTTRRKS